MVCLFFLRLKGTVIHYELWDMSYELGGKGLKSTILGYGLKDVWMDVATLSDSTFSLPCDVPIVIGPTVFILDELL